jgi:YebC/PmpR family DNA-binding regulatory protein
MSGHSKWSTIKRKKGAADAKRGKIFTKIARDIQIAARDGGPDPTGNPALRLALAAAKAANMPKDNQERAIKKGTGDLDGASLDEVVYEGRGPGGTAFLVETLTDNKNRTVAEVRHVFTKAGGELGSGGSVAWMFDLTGVVEIPRERIDEDGLTERAIEAGADDVKDAGESWLVLCDPTSLANVSSALEDLEPAGADRQYLAKPESTVTLEGDAAIAVAVFWAKLDELDDVQNVFTNADLPDEVMEEHGP